MRKRIIKFIFLVVAIAAAWGTFWACVDQENDPCPCIQGSSCWPGCADQQFNS